MATERTAWFPLSVKPVRKGWYEKGGTNNQGKVARYGYGFDRAYWNGRAWYVQWWSYRGPLRRSFNQPRRHALGTVWRGLAAPAKAGV